MKTKKLQPLDLFNDCEDLKKTGDYFINSFYHTTDKALLLHSKKQHSNTSSKSIKSFNFCPKSVKQKEKSSVKINRNLSQEAFNYFNKQNKLNILFNDPSTISFLKDQKPIKSDKTPLSTVIYSNRNGPKNQIKTKPARFSMQIPTKRSEIFETLLNKFQFNLKPETPNPGYLKEKINSFLLKTRFQVKKSLNSFLKGDYIVKIPERKDEGLHNLLGNEPQDKRKISFNLDTSELKRDTHPLISIKPSNFEKISKRNTEKINLQEMFQKKQEVVNRLNRGDLKIDIMENKNNDLEEFLQNSPLSRNQKRISQTYRPKYKRSGKNLRKELKKALNYFASVKLTILEVLHFFNKF